METKVLQKENLDIAVDLLLKGEVVAIPTETVYGLAANALDKEAISKIFIAKGRPQDNPLIVHISNLDMLKKLTLEVPKKAKILIEAFWGGALTMIFKKSAIVPDEISRGLDTVAIRMPNHKTAIDLIEKCGVPLAAPSANSSGRPSTTTYKHVLEDLNGKISAVICDKQAKIGLESTVLDMTVDPPILLRPGGISKEQIEEKIGKIATDKAVLEKISDAKKVRSPGMKYRHYAPKASMLVLCGNSEKTTKYIAKTADENDGILCFDEYKNMFKCDNILCFGRENDIESQANLLFLKLREFDELPVKKIYAQCPNDTGLGLAVANRLKKAAGFNILHLDKQIIGLTGSSGSGKTTVCEIFAKNGFDIIDTDKIYHDLVENSLDMKNELACYFPQVFENSVLNRKKLGEIVFNDSEKLQKLNEITHKFVENEVILQINTKNKIILDVPLMFEAKFDKFCEKVIGVIANDEIKIKRICKRDSISEDYAKIRLKNQKNTSFYTEHCDIIIENNEDLLELSKKVLEIIEGE